MAGEIVVPRLGWSMEQGVFLGWLKGDGETVRAGEPLFKLEGDKAEQEVEAVESGILRVAPNGPAAGDVVAVGALLGHLAAAARQRRPVSPRARRAARELGVATDDVRGTGRDGRVRERDVLALSARREPPPAAGPGQHISPARRTIAERMLHSQRSTAPVTLTTTADATNLVSLRKQLQTVAADGVVPSYTDLLVKLTALALRQHPLLAARWEEDQVVMPGEIHIGVAVDTDAGLLVPVVRDVPSLPLRQLAQRTRDLAEKARLRQLTPRDMEGGTFTVTNLGPFGIDAFTPIINWPECAILGVGRVQRRPAVVNDQVVSREQVTLSLTFDHRVVDGAPAARFLQTLCQGVENPSAWLVN